MHQSFISQHRSGIEKILNEMNMQNGFVGSKQYQHDWMLRKKEVSADFNKVLAEKIQLTNKQIYDTIDRIETVDKFTAKLNAKVKRLQQERETTEEHIDRKIHFAVDKTQAVQ
jgi:hypothetical protein